jgi:serine/threonine-protein kinase
VLDAAAAVRAAGLDSAAPAAGEAAAADPWDSPADQRVSGPAALGPGDRLGERFEIVALLGTGPAGSLFRARDKELGEVVALKVFEPAALTDAGQFERLDSDLQRVRKLIHPNIARTYDLGRAGGLPFLARELVAGTALADLLAGDRRLPAPAALRLARQLAEALAEAHGEGLVHGRLGLRNLLLEPTGRGRPHLRVADFGVASPLDAAGARWTGLAGTEGYLAPERAGGAAPHPSQDVYAAGVVAVELLTGRRPGPRVGAPNGRLRTLLDAMTEPDPARRTPSVGAALAHLHRLGVPHRLDDPSVVVPDRLGAPARPWRRRPLVG